MKRKLVTSAEFAALAGVSQPAITKARTARLKPAVHAKRIDLNHPAAQEYLERRRSADPGVACYTKSEPVQESKPKAKKQPKPKPAPKPKAKPPKSERIHAAKTAEPIIDTYAAMAADDDGEINLTNVPDNIKGLLNWTLGDLIDKFGTETSFVDWLNATQKIEGIAEKRLKNAQTEGELVSRDVVHKGMVIPLDAAFTRLLMDGSKTIATRLHAMALAGETVKATQDTAEQLLTSFIKPAQTRIARTLRGI